MPLTAAGGAAIAAGAQAAAAGTQAYMSGRANKKTIKANKELAELSYQRQVSMFNMANEYNSPEAQMERLRKAGLNPNLVYGSGADNTTAVSTPQYNPPDVTRKAYVPDFAPAVSNYLDSKLKLAQIDNIQANTDNVNARTETEGFNATLKRILGDKTTADIARIDAGTEYTRTSTISKSALTEAELSKKALENKELLQRISNMSTQQANMLLEAEYKRGKISQQQIDKEIKEADLLYKQNENMLRNMGINSGDNAILRILVRALNGSLETPDLLRGIEVRPYQTEGRRDSRKMKYEGWKFYEKFKH